MKIEEPLITVVVPIYNVEKYLKKCVDSIIKQTYNNIEIILVNDGSTDNSLKICNELLDKDKRIIVISQENGGLSEARNTGIKNAKGEYICFIDSDDFVDYNYIKILLNAIKKHDADISVCDFYYIDEENKKWIRKEKKEKVYTNIEAMQDIFSCNQETEVMTWNKLYKTSLFTKNNIYFPKGKIHEDNYTTYKLYYYSNKIALVTDRLYYYLQRKDSIMGRKFNIKRLNIIQAIEETKIFLKENNIDLNDEMKYYEFIAKTVILNRMIKDKYEGSEKNDIRDFLIKNKGEYLKNKYIDKKLKFCILFLFRNLVLYKILLEFIDKIKK